MLYAATPGPPVSVPDQLTVKLEVGSLAGNGLTALDGTASSMVFIQVGVWIGEFSSKTTVAVLLITVPVVSAAKGSTVKATSPSPAGGEVSGGRKPTEGSA